MNSLKMKVILLLSLIFSLWSLPGGCVEYMPLGRENSVQRINEEVEGDQEVELPFEDIPYDDDEMAYRAAEYLALGEYMNAIEVYERALNSYPEDPWLICSIEIYTRSISMMHKRQQNTMSWLTNMILTIPIQLLLKVRFSFFDKTMKKDVMFLKVL